MKYRILFNPKADSNHGKQEAEQLKDILKDAELTFADICEITDWKAYFSALEPDEKTVICGGDGTVSRVANYLYNQNLTIADLPEIYYFACGSGNDFLTDLGGKKGDAPVLLNPYLEKLPSAEIDGKDVYHFINGIGFGIDGYCCEEGDRQRAAGVEKINYTAIAIKGMLGKYSPRNAKVTVDGKEYSFKNVWLTPMMNGRYFGGGMMPTPNQDRLNKERTVSILIFSGRSRLLTLIKFPKIFSGEHLKFKNCVLMTGSDITVEYDRPTSLQVDGETVLGVTKCRCRSWNLTH